MLGKGGVRHGVVDWRGVHLDDKDPVFFDNMKAASVEEPAFRGKRLHVDGKAVVSLGDLQDPDAFLALFNHYWTRPQVARAAAARAAS